MLISECENYDYLKEIKSFNYTKSFFIKSGLSKEEIKMNKTYIDEYNNNGWTPLFTSIFCNNSSARRYFEKRTRNADHTDYFGNTAREQ